MKLQCAILALTFGVFVAGAPKSGSGAQLNSFQVGSWQGGAFTSDQTRQFSHCAAAASYKSGIFVSVGIDRSLGWKLGFADPAWNLTVGQQIPVTISFDGGIPWSGTAFVASTTQAIVPMAPNSALIKAFRAGMLMTVNASGRTFLFNLNGTSRLMPRLAQCVETQLAIERGEPPPSFGSSRPPAASSKPMGSPTPPGDAAAELQLAATRIATNLLLQSGLPNARLLSPAETPDQIKRLGVAWKSDAGMGAVELLAQGAAKDAQTVASQIIDSDAAACKGDFASGRSSELVDNTVVTKAFTGCKDSSGTKGFRYFVVHNEGAGYVVFALTSSTGASPPPSNSPLSDTNFQTAAVKAAFNP